MDEPTTPITNRLLDDSLTKLRRILSAKYIIALAWRVQEMQTSGYGVVTIEFFKHKPSRITWEKSMKPQNKTIMEIVKEHHKE